MLCCGWNRLAANISSSAAYAWLKRGGGAVVDVVSYHPYPRNWDPRTAADYTDLFRAALKSHGVSKPLWATEVGFLNGLAPATARALSYAEQVKLVTGTIDVLRRREIPVILWYPWDESDVGKATSNMVGLHRVYKEALAAAGGTATSNACDPKTQPAPKWGAKQGQCLPACAVLGGTSAFTTPCAQNGKVDAGQAYDVAYCCKDKPPVCDPKTQPSPQYGVKNGKCLPACGVLGGTSAYTTPCAKNGKRDAGEAYDVAYCCK